MVSIINFVWFLAFGWVHTGGWLILALFFYATVIGEPIGRACLEFAKFLAFPFGKELIKETERKSKNDFEGRKKNVYIALNITWTILSFFLIFFYISLGIIACLLVFTIPLGITFFKMVRYLISPIGVRAVSSVQAKFTMQTLEKEKEKKAFIYKNMEEYFYKSDFFIKEKIPLLMEKIKNEHPLFPFNQDSCFTLEEKKELGIKNTRIKMPRETALFFTEKALKSDYPKEIIKNIYYLFFHIYSRAESIKSLKEAGAKKIKILPVGDGRDCKHSKTMKKVYPINEAPFLPCPECDADYCRCCFVAHGY